MIRLFHQYVSAKGVVLFVVETALIAVTMILGAKIRLWHDPDLYDVFRHSPYFNVQMIARILVFQVCFLYGDLYAPRTLNNRNEQLISLGRSLGSGCLILGSVYFAFPELLVGRGVFVISTLMLAAGILLLRTAVNAAWKAADRSQSTIIVGCEALAIEVAKELKSREDLGARIVGFLSPHAEARGQEVAPGFPVLGTIDELEVMAKEHGVTRVIVAVENRRGVLPIRQLLRLRFEGLRIEDANDMLAGLSGRVSLKTIQPSWFIFSEGFKRSGFTMALKRLTDLGLSVVGLLTATPLLALSALAILLESGRPVFYKQVRVGLRGRPFHVIKLRSMRKDAEKKGAPQWATEDDPRVTRVGRCLRKFRFDEIPQFFNIIRGEMSFVGPRPERPAFVEQLRLTIPYYDERHFVRPGLTGWAQVQYAYGASEEDSLRKLEYDLFYLKNMSMAFDMLIVAKTMRIVFTGQGAR
jgi:sugar transferase (PEP-CTERM system associated)